jgi:hypothetical protein
MARTTLLPVAVAVLAVVALYLFPAQYTPSPITQWPAFSSSPQGEVVRLSRSNVKRIAENKIDGPETVIFSPSTGAMYALTESGALMYIDVASDDVHPAAFLSGRPLGADFAAAESTDDTDVLYVADALKGLLRVSIPKKQPAPPEQAVVEVVSTRTSVAGGGLPAGHHILYADDVAVGPKTGHVYFSDASDVGISRTRTDPTRWDTLGASIVDGIRGKRSGSLLVYDPKSRQTRALASGLWFANGVTVTPDESLVLVAETFLARVLSYDVRSGGLTPVGGTGAPLFTGYVDGAMHAEATGGSAVLVAVPSVAPKAVAILSKLRPVWLQTMLREVLLKLPPVLSTVKYACFSKINYVTGQVLQTYVDEDGESLECITSVVEKGGKFYLGSLKNHFVAVVDAV